MTSTNSPRSIATSSPRCRIPTLGASMKSWRRSSIPQIPTNRWSTAFLEQTAKPAAIKNLQAHDVKIRIMGDFAIIHAAFSYTTPDGQQAHGRYTDSWAKQNGKWLAVSAHATR